MNTAFSQPCIGSDLVVAVNGRAPGSYSVLCTQKFGQAMFMHIEIEKHGTEYFADTAKETPYQ